MSRQADEYFEKLCEEKLSYEMKEEPIPEKLKEKLEEFNICNEEENLSKKALIVVFLLLFSFAAAGERAVLKAINLLSLLQT